MPLLAIVLILLSSLLHALWNMLLKRSQDKLAFTALSLTVSVAAYLPLFLYEFRRSSLPPLGWACIAGTGIAYFGYFTFLADAYKKGDLSLVYPIARGAGPGFAFIGGAFFLSERPNLAGTLGVAAVILGVAALHFQGERHAAGRRALPSTIAALEVALMISVYSLIDKAAVGRLHINPPVYIYLTYSMAAVLVGTWTLLRRGPASLRAEWKINAATCCAVGVLNLFTYLLVLYAMSLPRTPIGYVAPLRSVSVLFGVLLGAGALGESGLRHRLLGAAIMISGIVLIAWKG
jgi:drug/metabolite transporter (DMT)-like permease